MRRVLAHIDDHLGEALTLERLSAVAAFSKFHFHRQFAAWTGLPVQDYVQAARTRLAAFRLAFRSEIAVSEIAFDCGYASPEAFARMFKQRTGQTPTAFRAQPDWARWQAGAKAFERARALRQGPAFAAGEVEIVTFRQTPVAVLEHRGAPERMGETIRRFIAWRKGFGLPPARSATFNLFYADPDAEEGFRMAVCAATRRQVPANADGVGATVIPPGRCARLRVVGSGSDLRAAVMFLYGEWLPQSGAELRDFPLFAQRRAVFPDVPESQTVTDVLLPVR
jgi:AraC family transcriptional regulator